MSAFEHSPWPRVRLGDLCAEKEWATPAANPELPFEYVDIASVCNQRFEISHPKTLLGRDAPSRARKRIRGGDVLVATTRPYLRSIARVPAELDGQVCSTGLCVLRPKAGVLSDWIFFSVLGDDFIEQLTAQMRGANYPAVADSDVLDAVIPVPEVAEQSRIVSRIKACMERVDEMELLREQSLFQQQYLSASLIESELGPDVSGADWTLKRIGELVTTVRNGRSIRQDTEGNADGAVLTLTAVRTIDLGLSFQKPIALPDEVATQFSIEEGDVFVSRANTIDLVGLSAVATERPAARLIYPDLLIKLKANRSKVLPRFLTYALRSAGARAQIKERAFGSSQTMVKISGERLREVSIPVPPLPTQEQIIARLDAAHHLIANLSVQSAWGEILALRGAVIRKAFAGEL
jgi:type I restriction enzyme S subunit